jgi:hypothetical protein
MPRRRRQARVAFARVYLAAKPELGEQIPFVGIQGALLESLQPGTRVTRYRRTWHMARYERRGTFITGQIGFDAPTSPAWSEEMKDFATVRPAQIAPFAIDLEQMRVAFRLLGTTIKPGTFQGSFQALLNEAKTPHRWTVRLEGVEQPPWEDWRARIERITEISAKLVRPNPHYDFEEIEHVFEDGNVDEATIGGKGERINTESGFFGAVVGFVLNGYGRLRAKAVRVEAGGERSDDWNSETERNVRKTTVPVDPETGDVTPEILRRALREPDERGET